MAIMMTTPYTARCAAQSLTGRQGQKADILTGTISFIQSPGDYPANP